MKNKRMKRALLLLAMLALGVGVMACSLVPQVSVKTTPTVVVAAQPPATTPQAAPCSGKYSNSMLTQLYTVERGTSEDYTFQSGVLTVSCDQNGIATTNFVPAPGTTAVPTAPAAAQACEGLAGPEAITGKVGLTFDGWGVLAVFNANEGVWVIKPGTTFVFLPEKYGDVTYFPASCTEAAVVERHAKPHAAALGIPYKGVADDNQGPFK